MPDRNETTNNDGAPETTSIRCASSTRVLPKPRAAGLPQHRTEMSSESITPTLRRRTRTAPHRRYSPHETTTAAETAGGQHGPNSPF